MAGHQDTGADSPYKPERGETHSHPEAEELKAISAQPPSRSKFMPSPGTSQRYVTSWKTPSDGIPGGFFCTSCPAPVRRLAAPTRSDEHCNESFQYLAHGRGVKTKSMPVDAGWEGSTRQT